MGAASGMAQVTAVSFSIASAAGAAAGSSSVLGSSVSAQRLQLQLSESVVTRLGLSESLI
jgi:hypothetical protein